jgi:hypothetical protein
MAHERPLGSLGACAVVATLIAWSSVVGTGEAAEGRACVPGDPYGVAVTPAVYLVNFLLLYIANPGDAANMPAHRTILPPALSACLEENPEGCPYAEFARFFDGDAGRNTRCPWPTACQTDPRWERLAPSVATHPDQINAPLGMRRAARLARRLGIDADMILTEREYRCTIGTPPRTPNQQTIFRCITNLTNSNGNTEIPLSSYGLALTDQGDVQSLCAPEAPCLVFNQLFAGPLEQIALECGWELKLERMVRETPFLELVDDGHQCQEYAGAGTGACIVGPICPPALDQGRPGVSRTPSTGAGG